VHHSNNHKLIRSQKTQNTTRLFAVATIVSAILFSSLTISTIIPVNAASSGFDEPITLDGEEGKVGYDTSIAIGIDENPVISYRDLENEDLKIVHCLDPVCDSFANPITLDSQGMVGRDSSIAIGADGNPIVSYYDRSNKDLKVVHCNNKGCTNFDESMVLDNKGDVGRHSSMTIGTDGNPVISYFDNSNNSLKVIHCIANDCSTFDSPITLDNEGAVGRDSSIVIGTDSNPVISYRSSTNADLKIIHCTSLDCQTFDAPVILDDQNSVGFDSSLAIGTDGYPIVSYYDNTNADLKIVHCTSLDCSTDNVSTVLDSQGIVGRDSSIAIGTDGNPVISYTDDTFGNLKIIHCLDVSCMSKDIPVVLDNSEATGVTPSVAIGVDGYPIVSYFDALTSDLKMVHCNAVNCSLYDNTF